MASTRRLCGSLPLFCLALAALAIAIKAQSSSSGGVSQAVAFADANWNCLNVDCTQRVSSGTGQPDYACAPFVAHALAAGGFVPVDPRADNDVYSSVNFNGRSYNLNCCYHLDSNPSCHGVNALGDYLLARGWVRTNSVVAGTACIVEGAEGPYSHAVFGVGDGIVDAHNDAHYHVPSSNYQLQLCLNPGNGSDTGGYVSVCVCVGVICLSEGVLSGFPCGENEEKAGTFLPGGGHFLREARLTLSLSLSLPDSGFTMMMMILLLLIVALSTMWISPSILSLSSPTLPLLTP